MRDHVGVTTPALCARFHRASELIGRRWTGAIIFVLLKSRCRFATLRDAIPDITDRMLCERLQELEQEGIVDRTVVPETPVAAVRRGRETWLVSARGRVIARIPKGSEGALTRIWVVWAHKWVELDPPAAKPAKTTRLRRRA